MKYYYYFQKFHLLNCLTIISQTTIYALILFFGTIIIYFYLVSFRKS